MGLMEAVDLLLEKVLVRYLFLRLAGSCRLLLRFLGSHLVQRLVSSSCLVTSSVWFRQRQGTDCSGFDCPFGCRIRVVCAVRYSSVELRLWDVVRRDRRKEGVFEDRYKCGFSSAELSRSMTSIPQKVLRQLRQ